MSFKKREGCGPFKNQKLFEAVISIMQEKGVPIYKGTAVEKNLEDYPYLVWGDGYFVGWRNPPSDSTIYTLDEFLAKIEEFVPTISNKLQITNDYEAEIVEEGIKVGCQLITFEKFEELKTLVVKIKEQNS